MTLIPEGARHIRVAHRSRNHLGIAGSEGGGTLLAAWEQPGSLRPGEEDAGVGRLDGPVPEPGLTFPLQR